MGKRGPTIFSYSPIKDETKKEYERIFKKRKAPKEQTSKQIKSTEESGEISYETKPEHREGY